MTMLDKVVPPKQDVDIDHTVRGMENPIVAMFDLADETVDRLPYIRKLLGGFAVFVAIWLIVNFVLILATMATGQFVMFMILVAFFVLGALGLYWIYTLYHFFEYFGRRQHAIKTIRDAEELVYIPKGKDCVDSYVKHLRKESRALDNYLGVNPQALHRPAILTGVSGVSYHFDGYIFSKRRTTMGFTSDMGYAFFIKTFKKPPTMSEINALERAVQDVANKMELPPSRIVALVETPGEMTLDDDVYEHVTTRKVVIRVAGKKVAVNLQVVTTDTDGTYDFVPVIAASAEEMP